VTLRLRLLLQLQPGDPWPRRTCNVVQGSKTTHDAWVVGNEPYVGLDMTGSAAWAKPQ
jgi:hypothetical protein